MNKAVFFDFDGVIVDSTEIKTDAFYELFLEFGAEKAEEVKKYHLKNEGVDRFSKLKYIFSYILNLPFSQEREDNYALRFSRIVFEKIIKCPFIPGAIDFLEEIRKQSIKCFLLSATPESELREICKIKEIDFYFSKICGSPKSKVENGIKIISDFLLDANKITFFGDSQSDLEASQSLGTNFIGITCQNRLRFVKNIPVIVDFREIDVTKAIL